MKNGHSNHHPMQPAYAASHGVNGPSPSLPGCCPPLTPLDSANTPCRGWWFFLRRCGVGRRSACTGSLSSSRPGTPTFSRAISSAKVADGGNSARMIGLGSSTGSGRDTRDTTGSGGLAISITATLKNQTLDQHKPAAANAAAGFFGGKIFGRSAARSETR